jgi:carbonic anhydrase/acetyltransferase-like protein (isoleucine patch superfamily)
VVAVDSGVLLGVGCGVVVETGSRVAVGEGVTLGGATVNVGIFVGSRRGVDDGRDAIVGSSALQLVIKNAATSNVASRE